ncbi:class I SAM-dependent methyltransferase [Streptomyces sp. NPDC059385]|uniref:class I SAM-dependent methyltransferase n=1 Tax=Streptomyces sp. NPDC059385 TaxID=3346817 RepID=UPI0036D07966
MTMFEAYSDSRPPRPVENGRPKQEHERTPDLIADAGPAPSVPEWARTTDLTMVGVEDWDRYHRDGRTARVLGDIEIREFYEHAKPQEGMQALDLGCGRGAWTRQLGRYGIRTVGYDYSPVAITAARAGGPYYGQISFVRCDLNAEGIPLTVEPGSVDIVSMRMSLEHLDRHRLMTDVRRVLAPGGLAYVMTKIMAEDPGDPLERGMSRDQFGELAEGWSSATPYRVGTHSVMVLRDPVGY